MLPSVYCPLNSAGYEKEYNLGVDIKMERDHNSEFVYYFGILKENMHITVKGMIERESGDRMRKLIEKSVEKKEETKDIWDLI